LNFFPSLAWSPPTEHNGRPPTAHLPENRGGGPNFGSRAQWPTSRLLPIRAVKSHALGSINRTQERWGKEDGEKGGGNEKNRGKKRDPKERERREEREKKKKENRRENKPKRGGNESKRRGTEI
jgi:hypothetical protein